MKNACRERHFKENTPWNKTFFDLIQNFIQGGSERQMVQLTKLLRESGRYRVHVACLNGEGSLRNELERSGVNDILEYPLTSFYNRNMVSQLGRFTTYLKEHKIDVVHTHDFYSNVFGMTGAMLTRVPARVASRREIGGIRTSNQKRVERIAFRLATGIVTNAEAVRAQLVSEGVAIEKVRVVYNGLDLNRMAPLLSSGIRNARCAQTAAGCDWCGPQVCYDRENPARRD